MYTGTIHQCTLVYMSCILVAFVCIIVCMIEVNALRITILYIMYQ